MEMVDLGTRPNKSSMVEAAGKPENRVYYPELRVEKDLGDYKPGQAISLMGEGVVTGIRKDKYGESLTIEVRRLACSKKAEANKVGRKLAEDYLSKKG